MSVSQLQLSGSLGELAKPRCLQARDHSNRENDLAPVHPLILVKTGHLLHIFMVDSNHQVGVLSHLLFTADDVGSEIALKDALINHF